MFIDASDVYNLSLEFVPVPYIFIHYLENNCRNWKIPVKFGKGLSKEMLAILEVLDKIR